MWCITNAPLVSTLSSIRTQLPLGSEDEHELSSNISRASSNKFKRFSIIVRSSFFFFLGGSFLFCLISLVFERIRTSSSGLEP